MTEQYQGTHETSRASFIFGPEDVDQLFGLTPEPSAQAQDNVEVFFDVPIYVPPLNQSQVYTAEPQRKQATVYQSENYQNNERSAKRVSRKVLVLGSAAVAVLLGAGVATVFDAQTTPKALNESTPITSGANPVLSSETPTSISASPSPSPTPIDYKLSFISFGSVNDGCRELGTYIAQPSTLAFTLRGHPHTLVMPQTKYDLLTCGKNPQIVVNNEGVDAQSNVTKKVVSINQSTLEFKSSSPAVSTIASSFMIHSVLPAQQLIAKGYTGTCTAFPKMVGCPNVPVPAEYMLSASEVTEYKLSAAMLALQSIEKSCAKVEFSNEKKAIDIVFDSQAIQSGVDKSLITPNLITEKYLTASGANAVAVPDYITPELVQFIAAGGAKKPATLFDKPRILTKCTPDNIKPATN
jgi:hypothetical protein